MLTKKEIKLLKFIKYAPILIVSFLCLTITFLLYIEKNIILKKDLDNIKNEYLEKNKHIVKNEVEKVYNYIFHKKENSENELKLNIKNRVLEAHSIMTFIYEKYKDRETKEQIKQRIKDSLRSLRFNDNRGYFYINDMQGYNILHPLQPKLEDTLIIEHKDSANQKIVQNIIKDLENSNESYNILYWQKPEDLKNQYKKITPSTELVR